MTGKMGRPPKPTALKLLRGNPGKRPINENEPKPKPIAPKCPSWLNKEAKKEYRFLSEKLEKLGLLTEIDGAALSAYCQCFSRWKEAEMFIQENGSVFQTPSGYIQQVPHVSMAQKYLQLMLTLMGKFGLSPADRTGLNVPIKEQIDPFEGFLTRGKKKA